MRTCGRCSSLSPHSHDFCPTCGCALVPRDAMKPRPKQTAKAKARMLAQRTWLGDPPATRIQAPAKWRVKRGFVRVKP
jgi:hypothetical protein